MIGASMVEFPDINEERNVITALQSGDVEAADPLRVVWRDSVPSGDSLASACRASGRGCPKRHLSDCIRANRSVQRA